jgi:hypothetical protein
MTPDPDPQPDPIAPYKHPFSREARRNAVMARLQLLPDWSDRRLAADLGVSRDLVASIRIDLTDSGQIPTAVSRSGRDGKTYSTAGRDRTPVTGIQE